MLIRSFCFILEIHSLPSSTLYTTPTFGTTVLEEQDSIFTSLQRHDSSLVFFLLFIYFTAVYITQPWAISLKRWN